MCVTRATSVRYLYVDHALVYLRAVIARWLPRFGPEDLAPLALLLALGFPVGLLVGVPTQGLGVGLLLGVLVGVGIAWTTRRLAAAEAQRFERKLADAAVDADRRVALVTRQYEWAVNDVANLRDALRKSQTARAEAEEHARTRRERITELEDALAGAGRMGARPRPAIALGYRVYEERSLSWLRVESIDRTPAQIRVRGRTGMVVAISAPSLETEPDRPVVFVVRIPEEIASAIARHDDSIFTVEALLDDAWVAAELRAEESAQRPAPIRTDKRGRVWRRQDEAASAQA